MKFSSFITPFLLLAILFTSCKTERKDSTTGSPKLEASTISHAKGFRIEKSESGITIITITSPWLAAKTSYRYALVPREKLSYITLNKDDYDAIIAVPLEKIVVTSTTHIPALEALGVTDKLVGFPQTNFISSSYTRKRIAEGYVQELGTNEAINTELLLLTKPDVVVGFGINNQNKAYETIQRSNIPIVYNGDWTEETPLGKAEWIKFFAPFFGMEKKADSIFKKTETSYNEVKLLAQKAKSRPTVLVGGLYKDVWYVAGGGSWMGQFLTDAHTDYLWSETTQTGSIPISIETVLEKAQKADFWLNPSLHASQKELQNANAHYTKFDAFKNKKIFTHTNAKGTTGGLLFFEVGPNRPDLVLKDLIHIFHPELVPNHKNVFFSSLE